MTKTLILYFSGTGNSKFLARVFAKEMGAACFSIEEEADFQAIIAAHDTIAFSFPTYGSRVPRIMREFVIKHTQAIRSKKLILFCNQMAFSGDGARAFTYIFPKCLRKKLRVIYAEHFIMPNNIGNVIVTPLANEKQVRRKFRRAKRKMQAACANIKAGSIIRRGFNPISRALGLIQGTFFPLLERMAKDSVRITDDCINCGLCVKECPMKNLACENGKIISKGNCITCYRCVNHCPQKCITAAFHAKVNKQYRGLRSSR